jgi:hypothetical protein
MVSGLSDVLVVYRHDAGIIVIFIELKSRRGEQGIVRTASEMLPAGAVWWTALHRSA